MPQLRFWQESDLPHLLHMSGVLAWSITPEDDRPGTTFEMVTGNARRSLIAALSSPGGTAIVADEGGRPVGFLLIGIQQNDKTGEPYGYMADIYVEPAFQRHGLGRQMHLIGEEYLRGIGIRKVANWTHAHNPLGQSASLRHGFRLWSVMMVKHLRAPQGAPQVQAMGAGL